MRLARVVARRMSFEVDRGNPTPEVHLDSQFRRPAEDRSLVLAAPERLREWRAGIRVVRLRREHPDRAVGIVVANPATRGIARHAAADDQVAIRPHPPDRSHGGQDRAVESRAALTKWRIRVLVAAVIVTACLALPASGADNRLETDRVAIFYYPWYSTPAKDGRWAHWYVDRDGTPVLSTGYFPSRGLYSSSNATIVA